MYSAVSKNSQFELCDKNWHSVKAEVVGDIIELHVDDNEAVYDFSYNPDKDIDTSSALYIGGLPGNINNNYSITNKSLFRANFTNTYKIRSMV